MLSLLPLRFLLIAVSLHQLWWDIGSKTMACVCNAASQKAIWRSWCHWTVFSRSSQHDGSHQRVAEKVSPPYITLHEYADTQYGIDNVPICVAIGRYFSYCCLITVCIPIDHFMNAPAINRRRHSVSGLSVRASVRALW